MSNNKKTLSALMLAGALFLSIPTLATHNPPDPGSDPIDEWDYRWFGDDRSDDDDGGCSPVMVTHPIDSACTNPSTCPMITHEHCH